MDIAERLIWCSIHGDQMQAITAMEAGASEIARLQVHSSVLMREIARLRAALDRAADALEFYDNKTEALRARAALAGKEGLPRHEHR